MAIKKKKAFWGLVLLGIAISGPPRPRLRAADAVFSDTFDASSMFEIAFWVVVFLYVANILVTRVIRGTENSLLPSKFIKGAAWAYFLYATFALISAIYSVFPMYTLYFSLKFLSFIILAAYVAMKYQDDPWILFKILFITCGLILGLKIVLYLIDPSWVGVQTLRFYRMTGGWLGGYGLHATISCLALIVYFLLKKPKGGKKLLYLTLMAVCLYFIYLSRTRQIYVLFLIASTSLIFLGGRLKHSRYNLIVFTFIIGSVVLLQGFGDKIWMIILREQESLSTLSGRTTVMQLFLRIAEDYLPWGQGFVAGSRYWLVKYEFFKRGFGAAHESIGTVVLELGIPGAILLFLVLILAWKQFFTIYKYSYRMWMNNSQKSHMHLLIVLIGAILFARTLTIMTSVVFAHSDSVWIILLVSLQVLNRYKLREILSNNSIKRKEIYANVA